LGSHAAIVYRCGLAVNHLDERLAPQVQPQPSLADRPTPRQARRSPPCRRHGADGWPRWREKGVIALNVLIRLLWPSDVRGTL
jgi:hypothetical protein